MSEVEEWNKNSECLICFEDILYKDEIICSLKCECKNQFRYIEYHRDCIVPWIKYHGSCPICKKNTKINYLLFNEGMCFYPQSLNDNVLIDKYEDLIEYYNSIEYKITFRKLKDLVVTN